MLSFCPWSKTALEVASKLIFWLQTWLPENAESLEPKDWFYREHDLAGEAMEYWVKRRAVQEEKQTKPRGF